MSINRDIAFKIYGLGVADGCALSKLGISSMREERQDAIIGDCYQLVESKINTLSEALISQKLAAVFYEQYFTAKTAYRFGVQDGFSLAEIQLSGGLGLCLTEENLNELIYKTFKDKGTYEATR